MKNDIKENGVRKALNHEVSDRVPIDLGSTPVTTIHALAQKTAGAAGGWKTILLH